MGHVIDTIRNTPIADARRQLEEVYKVLHRSVIQAQQQLIECDTSWGCSMKRLMVPLEPPHPLIDKPAEKFVELINIMATTERTISALTWFEQEFPGQMVRECHASTSDDEDGNDIVITTNEGKVLARCEVCDVASSNPGQNGKEKKDLRNLGCETDVPQDGARRFTCTSTEFANALGSPRRKWSTLHYRYQSHPISQELSSRMLEIHSGD